MTKIFKVHTDSYRLLTLNYCTELFLLGFWHCPFCSSCWWVPSGSNCNLNKWKNGWKEDWTRPLCNPCRRKSFTHQRKQGWSHRVKYLLLFLFHHHFTTPTCWQLQIQLCISTYWALLPALNVSCVFHNSCAFASPGYLACYSSGRWCSAESYQSRWRPGLSWWSSGLCLLHTAGRHIWLSIHSTASQISSVSLPTLLFAELIQLCCLVILRHLFCQHRVSYETSMMCNWLYVNMWHKDIN